METNQAVGAANPDVKTTIDIEVNNRPVILRRREVTGHDIKVAAIQQGVAIELDFLLYIVRSHGQLDPVNDNEEVMVHEHERFRAVTPDDVSEG
jgi:Multiubiquitin